ncbi:MAG: ABC transporter ATP-binding protein [Chloroflexi bacterium]|nr:ABC transporter ATP-binding protein [Chloroflexota bacterium]
MIRLEQVTRYYGNTIAVNELSLEVSQGEVCVLIGPSGCGKTTTLRMVNRLIEPTAGHIFINGQDNSQIKPERLRQSIGYAIQSVGLFPHMTVAANIATVPELLHWEKSRIASRIEELLILVGLNPAEYARKYPNQLSGGEAQRVGVARALAADPPILLMDEPFGAVDPLTRERLQSQFARIQQKLKKTTILVTHDLDEAIRLADRIAIMASGKLVQYDTPETILSRPANKFVHDFVGTDRALKRLSRISIQSVIKPSPAIVMDVSIEEAVSVIGSRPSVWVVADDGRFIGWVDMTSLSAATSVREAIVRSYA